MMDDVQVTAKAQLDTTPKRVNLLRLDQFKGESGSCSAKTTRLGSRSGFFSVCDIDVSGDASTSGLGLDAFARAGDGDRVLARAVSDILVRIDGFIDVPMTIFGKIDVVFQDVELDRITLVEEE